MAQYTRRAIGLLRGGVFALLSLVSAAVITAEVTTVSAPPASPPVAGVADVSPVTDAMLLHPPAADWLMWRGTLNSWGYSPLNQVTAQNVGLLQLVWTRALEPGLQEGTPLVHDGVLYFPNPGDTIDAVDAASGDLIWQHRRTSPPDIEKYINAPFINRNLAIHGDLIIDTSADGAIYAIDARTGKSAWSTQVLDYKRGIHQTSGPIVADGKVFSGRGCEPLPYVGPTDCVITAHDAVTGKELWRRRTIPGPGEPGDESWGDIPYAERKHVGTWMPPSYDPELHLLIIGTSVTSPAPKFLLGGNDKQHLYHNSTLALDPDTGKIVWYYQHLIDHWDLDHPFERILLDEEVAPSRTDVAWINPDIKPGAMYPVVTGIPGKTGIVYTLDRRNGQFLWARPTIYQNVVESIDGRTGAVKQTAATQFHATGDSALVCPNSNGGKNWPAGAYSPLTRAMYYPLQNTCAQITVVIHSRKENSAYGVRSAIQLAPGTQNVGSIHAISAVSGKTDWKFEQRAATFSLLTTGGGLLFGGDVAGRFRAYDQKTGEVLWEVNLGSPVTGYPVSFAVHGRQYIAISTGSSVSGAGHLALTPEIRVGNGNNLYVFALPEGVQVSGAVARPARRTVVAAAPAPIATSPNCQPQDLAEDPPAANRLSPDGRFSLAQSAAGRKLYAQQQCATCHGATMGGSPGAPALNDVGFRGKWRGHSLNALLACARSTMPPGRAGTLSDAQYLALIAAILEANGFKPGTGAADLPADAAALSRIGVEPGR
jgi:alcohol dehydrogenase (cytochrome c)